MAKLGTLANISSRAATELPAGMVYVAWIGYAGKITIPFASLTGTGAPVWSRILNVAGLGPGRNR